jgi:hypothetical protein
MDYKFEIPANQVEKLEAWMKKIKKKHGEYGTFTYSFTPVGMGVGIKVKSRLTKKKLDLSDVEHW